jgi:hypothetical protein
VLRRRLLACSLLVLVAGCGLPQPKIPSLGGGPLHRAPTVYSIPLLGTSRSGSTTSTGPAM